jgi:hypothetical protein
MNKVFSDKNIYLPVCKDKVRYTYRRKRYSNFRIKKKLGWVLFGFFAFLQFIDEV